MKITAEQKYIRMSARKLRLVVDAVKHLSPQAALKQLEFMNKRATTPVSKVIKQAVANATNNFRLNPQQLKISEVLVNEGSTYKRWRPVSRGRAHSILKRTSHVKVILETVSSKPVIQPKPSPVVKKEAVVKSAKKTVKPVKSVSSKKTVSKKTTTNQSKTSKKT